MATFTALVVLIACAAVEGASSAAEQQILKAGNAIPAVLNKQWTDALTTQRKQVADLQAAVVKGQSTEVNAAITKAAAVANENQVVQLRKDKIALLTNWENHVIEINAEYRRGYLNAFQAATKQAAAAKPEIRKAIRAAFVRLLGAAVKGQEQNIALLTTKQFPLIENFALLGGQILIELVVAGQGAQI
ncbi:uncharacterized protein LOC113211714 isoform X2 [Frankliniella occidentalis]|uniref:Uncharacterized protein LOC113211714 isoform X2 n=1 Tax=Frankliniella occidentalis TaxID=133901 RepID=A0A9C6WS91_FRAOC|nr:uncharacterized protein LOC113211714 isoform X2 [Frankliniella occidentalis]